MTDTTTENSQQDATRNSRRVLEGVVSSDAMDKSITVRVERILKHRKYKKYIRRHSTVHAHDEQNEAEAGDRVEVMECRPLSKTKRFRLLRVIDRTSLPAGALNPAQLQAAATADAMGTDANATPETGGEGTGAGDTDSPEVQS